MEKKEPTLKSNERLWTKEDVCEFLGCSRASLYRLVERREIPFLRVNNKLRFLPEQMWAWAKKKTQSAS